ncbi:MAG: hypothetical protein LLG00_15705 [Planctomycetaceae bacterium]|nr:hypothetical protein [Planctomycetaceae bacterium]
MFRIVEAIEEERELGRSSVRLAAESCPPMLLSDSDEYKEGEAAVCRGATTRDNPYPFLSAEYWRWQEGLLGNCSIAAVEPRKVVLGLSARRVDHDDEAIVSMAGREAAEQCPVLVGAP